MLRALASRLREWIAVEDPEDRIEGSGKPIHSPQHRRSPEAQRKLEQREGRPDENRRERP